MRDSGAIVYFISWISDHGYARLSKIVCAGDRAVQLAMNGDVDELCSNAEGNLVQQQADAAARMLHSKLGRENTTRQQLSAAVREHLIDAFVASAN